MTGFVVQCHKWEWSICSCIPWEYSDGCYVDNALELSGWVCLTHWRSCVLRSGVVLGAGDARSEEWREAEEGAGAAV